MRKIYNLSFLVFLILSLSDCSKKENFAKVNSILFVKIGVIKVSTPLIDYSIAHKTGRQLVAVSPFKSKLGKSSLMAAGPGSSVSTWQQVIGGQGMIQYLPVTASDLPVKDSLNLASAATYTRSLTAGTYNIQLYTRPTTVPADTFIRFKALDSNMVINQNTVLNFQGISSDGLITVAQNQVKAGTVPSVVITTNNIATTYKFGLINGYYYIYISDQSTANVILTALSGQVLTKEITVLASNQYNLIVPSVLTVTGLAIVISPFSLNNVNLELAAVVVSTVAGSANTGYTNGPGLAASFTALKGMSIDATGNMYAVDNLVIRRLDNAFNVTTYAGTGYSGLDNGPKSIATFTSPAALQFDPSGNLFITDQNMIRKLDLAFNVSNYTGTAGQATLNDGSLSTATFASPVAMAFDAGGNMLVVDANRIRKIDVAGNVTTIAGSGQATSTDGNGLNASFNHPSSISVDGSGNIFVGDKLAVRKIDVSGNVTTVAGTGIKGTDDGKGTAASFLQITALAADASSNLYVGDSIYLRKVDPFGNVTTLAGNPFTDYGDGVGSAAGFHLITGIAMNRAGNLIVSDNHFVRQVNLNH